MSVTTTVTRRKVVLLVICCILAVGQVVVIQSSWYSCDNNVNDRELPEEFSSAASLEGAPHQERGVDPAYLRILHEAERRSALDFKSSHTRGDKGFVIGPTEGDFARHTERALRNARRLRNVLGDDNKAIKIALMTSPDHIKLLDQCKNAEKEYFPEACSLWANGALFDDVIATKEGEFQHNDNHTNLNQGSSKYWLKALGGYRNAPYTTSIFLDSDAYPCPGVEKLLDIATPVSQRYWQFPNTAPADFAAGLDQFPFGTGSIDHWVPGDPRLLEDFKTFAERNTGTTLFHFHRKLAHTFAHFISLVSEHIYNNVATTRIKVINDQCPFKVALYLFRRLQPDFVEHHIPMHAACRAYLDMKEGTDALANGMYPVQQDGTRCKDCRCTPCLIAHHAGTLFVTIDGQKGWEDDFQLNTTNL